MPANDMRHDTISASIARWWDRCFERIGDAFELYSLNEPLDDEPSFQQRAQAWLLTCFGPLRAERRPVRTHRFVEEAVELAQSLHMTEAEVCRIVSYVFKRPAGDPYQEVGGVMVTLAGLCAANDMDMHEDGEIELARCWQNLEKIRANNAAKPAFDEVPAPSAPNVADKAFYDAAARVVTSYFADKRGFGAPGRTDDKMMELSHQVWLRRDQFYSPGSKDLVTMLAAA